MLQLAYRLLCLKLLLKEGRELGNRVAGADYGAVTEAGTYVSKLHDCLIAPEWKGEAIIIVEKMKVAHQCIGLVVLT